MSIPSTGSSISRLYPLITSHYPAAPKVKTYSSRRAVTEGGSLLTALFVAMWSFALCSTLQAVSPAPGGGYSNFNTAEGTNALLHLTSGSGNTANGSQALLSDTTGYYNTANGYDALYRNSTGYSNTAIGTVALLDNTIGYYNTANGYGALYHNTSGIKNTAEGAGALTSNTTGSANIALGYNAGYYLTTGHDNIDIGNFGVAGESSKIRIGIVGTQTATFIAGINGVALSGAAVVVSSSGQLGVAASSKRFKEAIKPMDKASEAILALKPVTFRYKKEIDPEGISQFGLVAEEVEKVNPDLVVRDKNGKIYTVRYEAVNAMLLNEFLKEHRAFLKEQRKVEEQEATIAQLKKDFQSKLAEQQKQIKGLASGLEQVSAQFATGRVRTTVGLELRKPAPQSVANNQ